MLKKQVGTIQKKGSEAKCLEALMLHVVETRGIEPLTSKMRI